MRGIGQVNLYSGDRKKIRQRDWLLLFYCRITGVSIQHLITTLHSGLYHSGSAQLLYDIFPYFATVVLSLVLNSQQIWRLLQQVWPTTSFDPTGALISANPGWTMCKTNCPLKLLITWNQNHQLINLDLIENSFVWSSYQVVFCHLYH